jgi:hypothetical protein
LFTLEQLPMANQLQFNQYIDHSWAEVSRLFALKQLTIAGSNSKCNSGLCRKQATINQSYQGRSSDSWWQCWLLNWTAGCMEVKLKLNHCKQSSYVACVMLRANTGALKLSWVAIENCFMCTLHSVLHRLHPHYSLANSVNYC